MFGAIADHQDAGRGSGYPAELRAQCLAVQRPNETNPLGFCCDIVKSVFSTTLYDAAPVRERDVVRQPIDRSTLHWQSLVTWRGFVRRMRDYGMAAVGAKRSFATKLSMLRFEMIALRGPHREQAIPRLPDTRFSSPLRFRYRHLRAGELTILTKASSR